MYHPLKKKTIKLETLPEKKKKTHISKGRQINRHNLFSIH